MSERDRAVIAAVQDGIAIEHRPFAAAAVRAGMSESEMLDRLRALVASGCIRRFGVVVRHHELGWRANAMVVLDVPDPEVDAAGERLARCAGVTLCYRRPRQRPHWPYNLFCMVHGRDRESVRERIAGLRREAALEDTPFAVLFSTRRFKQRGARYLHDTPAGAHGKTLE